MLRLFRGHDAHLHRLSTDRRLSMDQSNNTYVVATSGIFGQTACLAAACTVCAPPKTLPGMTV